MKNIYHNVYYIFFTILTLNVRVNDRNLTNYNYFGFTRLEVCLQEIAHQIKSVSVQYIRKTRNRMLF